MRIAPTTAELLRQRAEYVAGQGVPLFELRPPVFAGLDWAIKRAFDVVVSGLLILIALPIWGLIALWVKLDSPGPVFYRDQRIGLGEREFGMFKFRSMYTDAASRQAGLEESNEASGPLFKIKDDPRVTRVGRILRRYSIDEMPQVLNVVLGDMSLVGPRPLPLRDYVQLEDWHRKRYLVLPGDDGPVAGLRPDRPQLRRPRPPRLLLPRELVDLARHLDPREDAAGGARPPRRLLSRRDRDTSARKS